MLSLLLAFKSNTHQSAVAYSSQAASVALTSGVGGYRRSLTSRLRATGLRGEQRWIAACVTSLEVWRLKDG